MRCRGEPTWWDYLQLKNDQRNMRNTVGDHLALKTEAITTVIQVEIVQISDIGHPARRAEKL